MEHAVLQMYDQPWILILEPDEIAREIISEEISKVRKIQAETVFVETADQLTAAIVQRQVLPAMLLIEWFPNDAIVWPSLAKLDDHGILPRLFLVAMTGKNGRQALTEAQRLGAKRFISKLPDNVAFRGKIADVFNEFASQCKPAPLALDRRPRPVAA